MSPRLGEVVLASQSDERLVELARAGHELAFAVIVERYGPELSALARRLSPDGKAEDIVQQAFLSAFAALHAGADVKHLRGWLYRIVRNAAARSQAPPCMPLDGATASGESIEDVVQQRALAMNALAELARLPRRQRQAMVGTALDGLGRAEVATSMGVSEGAVRQLVHRARARIRTVITAVTPWPLARWLAPGSPGTGGAVNVATGVGAAPSGGVTLKLGVVLASGAIATGGAVVGFRDSARQPQRAGPRAAAYAVHPRATHDDHQVVTVDVVARTPVQVEGGQAARTAGAVPIGVARVRARRGGGSGSAPQRGHRQGGGAGSRRGSRRDGRGGSSLGSGAGRNPSDGGGSSLGGGSEPSLGGGSGSSLGGGSGSRDGGGGGSVYGAGGGPGADGRSSSAPQAVIAADGGPTRGGDRGGSGNPGYSGSGSGAAGSGWGSVSGPAANSGSGSGDGGSGR